LQCTKIHAPFEVLSRYAEIMKYRMPIKQVHQQFSILNYFNLVLNIHSVILLGKVGKFCYLGDMLNADGGYDSAVMAMHDAINLL